jgi:hypothetical protein
MSPPTTTNRDPAEYLASVLPLNPIFQAEEILAARNRFLGRKESPPENAIWQLQQQREELQARINRLREAFWTSKPKELREALEGLQVDQFPELKLACERLAAAFRVRSEFPKIAQHSQFDPELFEKLNEIAVAAPRDAGHTKQAFFLRTSTIPKLHRRCVKMIKALREEFPDVFELEREWLQQIEQTAPISGKTASEKEADQRAGRAAGGVGWIAVLVAVSFIGRAVTVWNRTTNSTSRSNPAPVLTPQQQQDIQRFLDAQRQQQQLQDQPVVPPQAPKGTQPFGPSPSPDEVRKRLDAIRNDARQRLNRNDSRIPNVPTLPGVPQPRGP